jgi:SPFH domain / Band 7 family
MGWFSAKKPTGWVRKPGDLASRFEADDVKSIWFNKPFIVQEGTAALMFSKGRLEGRVEPGEHDIDGFLRRWFRGEAPTTVLIIDDGEFAADFTKKGESAVDGLYSREQITLSAAVRLTLSLADPELFYRNTMRDRKTYTIAELQQHLRPELHDALLSLTSVSGIEDLYNNPGLRQKAEQMLQERLGVNLAALGFAVSTVNVMSVTSPMYDAHRGNMAGVAMEGKETSLKAELLAVRKRAREIAAADAKDKDVGDAELRNAINQAVHELGLKERLRADEFQKLNATLEQDMIDFKRQRERGREVAELDHTLDVDGTKRAHGREQAALDLGAFLDSRIKEAQTGQTVRDLDRSGEQKDWELSVRKRDAALESLAKLKGIKTDDYARRADILGKADTATKIALGAGDAESLLELERMDQQGKMTPDQLLVLAAEKSPAVAQALVEKFKAEGRISEEMYEQQRKHLDQVIAMHREHAMQQERSHRASLDAMAQVATARSAAYGPGQQTVVASGFGTPTVINPPVPPSPSTQPPSAPPGA